MVLEAEMKFRVNDIKEIENRIRDMGAEFRAELWQSDTYYEHPCRSLKAGDEAFRIRTVRQGEDVRYYLTYKGPKISPRAGKSRIEYETMVENPEATENMLKALGFSEAMKIEKKREIYALQDMEFCLDTVSQLGTFVEIEVITNRDDMEYAVSRIREAASKLGLETDIRESYTELLEATLSGK